MSEPGSYSDEAHRAWLRDAVHKAATEIGASPFGKPVFGWRERSLSTPVRTTADEFWLRVVAEQRPYAKGEFWSGNVDANAITGVAKPTVVRHWDWDDGAERLRAEVMTLQTGQACSATPELRRRLELSPGWWAELRTSLQALTTAQTTRVHVRQADVTHRLRVFFGDKVADPTVSRWTAAHTDLHWANLTEPECALLDWEGWGVAPAGFDAACLYLHTLLVPGTAERVRTELAVQLDSRDGLLSQLYIVGRMLLRVNGGDYPDLAVPLHHHAATVLAAINSRR